MAYTTTPADSETIANLPGDIRAVTALVNSHTGATSTAHAASAISYGAGTVEAALNTAAGHEADQNNPHGVTTAQIGAVALVDAVTTATPNKVVKRDSNGKIAGDITGNAATATLATDVINSGIPSGVILMWSGSIATIPTGWKLCNGTNGTPDLTDRFILGAGNTYVVGGIGGEAAHVLTVSEMPAHSHGINTTGNQAGVDPIASMQRSNHTGDGYSYTGGGTQLISNTGNGTAHNNLPPFYALCFIMKS